MSKTINQKEYLKKYLSGDKMKKSKKKKRLESQRKGFKVIDDCSDLCGIPFGFEEEDEAPTIAEITYEDEKLKEIEQFKAGNKWKNLESENISKNFAEVSIRETLKEKADTAKVKKDSFSFQGAMQNKNMSQSSNKKYYSTHSLSRIKQTSDGSIFDKKPANSNTLKNPQDSSSSSIINLESSPLNRHFASISHEKIKYDTDTLPSKKKDRYLDSSSLRRKGNSLEEGRKSYNSEVSPQRRKRHDSDASPERRKLCDSNSSPPRRKRHDSHNLSPLKAMYDENSSPQRRKCHDLDVFPPGKIRHNSDDSTIGNVTYNATASPRRKIHDSDASPPTRKRHDSDASPPRRKRHDSDASPPRRKRHDSDASPSARKRHDSDASPPRKKRHDSDASPLRRKRHDSDVSPPTRKRHDSDASPPRRRRHDSDASPPRRKRGDSDASPPRKKIQEAVRPERNMKTADYLKARKFGKLTKDSPEDMMRREREAELQKQTNEMHKKWNKGVLQGQRYDKKVAEYVHEAGKSFARQSDDIDMNDQLKNKMREEDPMLEYILKKKANEDTSLKFPIYQGSFPPNRFNIKPGYRWDGVDRSTGYEKEWFSRQNSKKATDEESYKWSIEDM